MNVKPKSPNAIVAALSVLAAGCTTTQWEQNGKVSTPYRGQIHLIPGPIEAEHFDDGGPGVAYSDVDEANHGAAYRGVTHVDIEQRPDASNGYGIGWVRAGEWLAYSVTVERSGAYHVEIPVASPKKGGIFHIEVAGKDVSGPIDIPDTGAWTKLETIRVDGVKLQKGNHVLKLVMDANGDSGGIGDIDCLRFSLTR